MNRERVNRIKLSFLLSVVHDKMTPQERIQAFVTRYQTMALPIDNLVPDKTIEGEDPVQIWKDMLQALLELHAHEQENKPYEVGDHVYYRKSDGKGSFDTIPAVVLRVTTARLKINTDPETWVSKSSCIQQIKEIDS